MLSQQPPQTTTSERVPQSDHFRSLCSELDEYEHLPELTPGAMHPTRLLTGQNHEETLDESILAGLTLP
jgi:hypothetical protein